MLNFTILISEISDTKFMFFSILILSLYFFYKRNFKIGFLISGSAMLAMSTTYLLKNILQIPRPLNMLVLEDGFRFPSGHATISAVISGLFFVFLSKKVSSKFKPVIFLMCFLWYWLVSYSRLFLQVHILVDVIVGGLIGFLSVYLCYKFIDKFLKTMK